MIRTEFIDIVVNNEHTRLACNYRETGHEMILYIHGLGCSRSHFGKAFTCRDLHEYSILAPDLPGHGDSEKPESLTYAMEEHALTLIQLLDKFSEKKIHLVCHSMGGAIGLLLAEKLPERISSFINIEGNLIYTDSTTSRRVSQLTENEFTGTYLPVLLRNMENSHDAATRQWAGSVRKTSPHAFFLSSRSLAEWTSSGRLLTMFLALEIPKYYIYGEFNRDLAVLKQLGGIKKYSVSSSGHFPMIDNPVELFGYIAGLIKKK